MAKKLAKRNKPVPVKEAADEHLADAPVAVVAAAPEVDQEEKPHKRNPLPDGKISHSCKCGNVSTIYVPDPDTYDEKARIEMFKKRGSSYKPAICRWCISRLSVADRKAL